MRIPSLSGTMMPISTVSRISQPTLNLLPAFALWCAMSLTCAPTIGSLVVKRFFFFFFFHFPTFNLLLHFQFTIYKKKASYYFSLSIFAFSRLRYTCTQLWRRPVGTVWEKNANMLWDVNYWTRLGVKLSLNWLGFKCSKIHFEIKISFFFHMSGLLHASIHS
jgi:hypothetical protein